MSLFKKLPLHSEHLNLGAKITSFAGWQVPLFYTSIFDEYKHCRQGAALFDISHMGEFIFKGDVEASGIEKAVTPWIEKIPTGRSRYGFILNKSGGIIDDLLIFKISSDKILFVVNAAAESIDYKRLNEVIESGNLKNISSKTAKIDLQGPLAKEVLEQVLGFCQDISYFSFVEFDYKGEKILISRTGYTGELGYEIFMPNKLVLSIWEQFINHEKVKPAGFGARDILRLEMGYNLAGNELTEAITPLEAGLGKFINFDKDFIGKDALLKQKNKGVEKIQVAFIANSKRIPRPGYKIYYQDREIGEVTSGSFSAHLSAGIGLGYLKSSLANQVRKDDSDMKIIVGDNKKVRIEAQIVKLPFYKKGSARKNYLLKT
ncbi:MAG: glycine cleavage system aminomethyltransferase GcvT [Candidatus Omnitrophica bacterium]|nr:glycine cleavage system aminomethyltransferase GcvT [Candidatus Omnitrophota bacterium]